MEYLIIIISAVLVNNIVLSQFLGICPFLGVSGKLSTAVGMGAAVIFVMTMATIATYLIQTLILVLLGLAFLQTVAFILVIASLVQLVEIVLKKVSPALYQALGVFLPLITTNCAILGVAILVVGREYNLGQGVVFAIGSSVGLPACALHLCRHPGEDGSRGRTQGDEGCPDLAGDGGTAGPRLRRICRARVTHPSTASRHRWAVPRLLREARVSGEPVETGSPTPGLSLQFLPGVR
jgi:electron transport complex protein RnfA